MITSFFDTSALAKLFLAEVGSQQVERHVASLDDDAKVCSVLAQVEVRSALQRRLRNREMTSDQLRAAVEKLELLVTSWICLPLDNAIVDYASGVITRHALRSLDAVQLSSALSVRAELEPHEELLFVAVDERLLKAASAEGLTLWNPELDPAP